MIRTLLAFVVLATAAVPALAQSPIQASHIEANVPAPEAFEPLLRRDLVAFFKTSVAPSVSRVEFKLLRSAPTQTGVAYPKYYLWVTAYDDSRLIVRGAARIEAIERQRFEVLQFLTQAQVQSAPAEVSNIFPAALVRTVLSLASGK